MRTAVSAEHLPLDPRIERHWLVRLAAYALAGAAVTPVLGGVGAM